MRPATYAFLAIIPLIGFLSTTCNLSDGIGGGDSSSGSEGLCKDGHLFSATTPATCTKPSVPGTCTRKGCKAKNPEVVVTPALGHLGIDETQVCPDQKCTRSGCDYVKKGEGHLANWSSYIPGNGLLKCQRPGCTGYVGVGDKGLAGGIIIYSADGQDGRPLGFTVTDTVSGTVGFTAYYLEAASEDQATSIKWSASILNHITTGTAIGKGKANTAAIIVALGETADNYAAKAASSCNQGGKNDWFLPSIDELRQMYLAHKHLGITSGYYWSSSQFNYAEHPLYGIHYNDEKDHAYFQKFSDGDWFYATKEGNYNVRAIRAF